MPRRFRHWWVLTAALAAGIVAAIPACPVQDRQGRPLWRVATVHDGDTVTCLDESGRPHRIRLAGIDSPELGQPYGHEARAALARKLADGLVRVEGAAHDRHGRLLGTLYVGDHDVNRELVAEGCAWVFGGFAPDADLLDAETAARAARLGLWKDPRPRMPSDWRREHPAHR